MKYVVIQHGLNEYGFVFNENLAHEDMAKGLLRTSQFTRDVKSGAPFAHVVGAGFCMPVDGAFVVDSKRHSESLNVWPRAQDERVLAAPFTYIERPTTDFAESPTDRVLTVAPLSGHSPSPDGRTTVYGASKRPKSLLDKARKGRSRL